jgi:hypothetical protein
MMGPWLLYASLLNGATIALYQVRQKLLGFELRLSIRIVSSCVSETSCATAAQHVAAAVQGSPLGRELGEFVSAARVNILGLVPSIALK